MSSASATATGEKAAEKPLFTDKETKLLTVAMLSLKSGPPEIDMQKFTTAGGFNTVKTAQNTWGVLKKKLAAMSPAPNNEDGDPGSGSTAISSKPCATVSPNLDIADNHIAATSEKKTPKKRTKKDSSAEDDAETEESPTKKPKKTPTPRKTAAQKKAEAAAAETGEEGGEEVATGSPVKKPKKAGTPRKTAAQKKVDADAEIIKKEEQEDAEKENEDETVAEKENVAETEVDGEHVKMASP